MPRKSKTEMEKEAKRKAAAERKAKSRAKRKEEGTTVRYSTEVEIPYLAALRIIANHHEVTQSCVISMLIAHYGREGKIPALKHRTPISKQKGIDLSLTPAEVAYLNSSDAVSGGGVIEHLLDQVLILVPQEEVGEEDSAGLLIRQGEVDLGVLGFEVADGDGYFLYKIPYLYARDRVTLDKYAYRREMVDLRSRGGSGYLKDPADRAIDRMNDAAINAAIDQAASVGEFSVESYLLAAPRDYGSDGPDSWAGEGL